MSHSSSHFNVVVIGGGHAGAEAAWAASHILGAGGSVAMVTMDPRAIGRHVVQSGHRRAGQGADGPRN